MKVQVHAADEGGCGYYRMIWPAQAVAADGYCDVEIVLDGQLSMDLNVGRDGHRSVVGVSPVDADVVVFQRPLSRLLSEAIPFLKAQGIGVVVELDDDFQDIHPKNSAWSGVQPKLSPDTNWRHLRAAIARADVFVCTTPALAAKYGKGVTTHVVPNYLPSVYRDVKPNRVWSTPWRLGWSGSVATHPTDLQVADSGVRCAINELGGELHVIGTGVGVADRLRIDADEVHPLGSWVGLDEYPQAMALPHVGMVPLAHIPFNEAKSWLKGLEFAGAGVPFVASSTGPYRELRDAHGLGRIAKKPLDWAKHFRALANEVTWREESERQRQYVLDHMLIEQHAAEWAAAWMAAGAAARGRGVRGDGADGLGRVIQPSDFTPGGLVPPKEDAA